MSAPGIEASHTEATPDQPQPAVAAAPLGTSADRIASLDFIRGIAVLGILAANIVVFGQPFAAYMWPDAFLTPHGETSDWLWVAQFVLIDGKMRGLFTLLFGAGIMLFLEKAWSRGSGRWLQARRLVWLMLFGLIHFYLIWRGDILFLYSVVGLIALLMARWAAKSQLVLGLVGYVLGALLYAGMFGSTYFVADTEFGNQPAFAEMRNDLAASKSAQIADGAAESPIFFGGSYFDIIGHTVETHALDPLGAVLFVSFETFPLVLIGMALYRLGLFNEGFNRRKQKKWGWIGVIAGTALTIPIALWAMNTGLSFYGTLSAFLGFSPLPRLPVVLGLAALLALWGSHATGWLGQRFSAAGRMAFSNYLGTSILMMLVFHGWALGLYGELNRPQLYLVVLGAWAVMLAWSKPWLERYRYGPLEWLWRCLTYWRMFPLKR